jgi:hypothetical protein
VDSPSRADPVAGYCVRVSRTMKYADVLKAVNGEWSSTAHVGVGGGGAASERRVRARFWLMASRWLGLVGAGG